MSQYFPNNPRIYKACPDLQQNLAWSSYKGNDNLRYLSCICKSLLVNEM